MKSMLDPFQLAVQRAQQGKHWRRKEAIVVLKRWKESNMTVAEFVRAHQLPPKRVAWWKRRLRDVIDTILEPQETQFVEIQIAPQETSIEPVPATPVTPRPATTTSPAIEVVLRGNRGVRVEEGFDAVTLARVVEVLEALPC